MAPKYILVFICLFTTVLSKYYLKLDFNYLTYNSKDGEIKLNYTKPELKGSLKADLEYVEAINKDGVLTACLLLTRNNIVGNNIHVNTAIQNTKFDKTKVFDKILVLMIKNCISKLDEKLVDEVLSVEFINKYGTKHEKLLTFDRTVVEKEPTFDATENQLLDIIYKVKKDLIIIE